LLFGAPKVERELPVGFLLPSSLFHLCAAPSSAAKARAFSRLQIVRLAKRVAAVRSREGVTVCGCSVVESARSFDSGPCPFCLIHKRIGSSTSAGLAGAPGVLITISSFIAIFHD
jgi:hypothetical protein